MTVRFIGVSFSSGVGLTDWVFWIRWSVGERRRVGFALGRNVP